MQEVSGLKKKVAELEGNLGLWEEVDNGSCDQVPLAISLTV